jgi:hypothetical protein
MKRSVTLSLLAVCVSASALVFGQAGAPKGEWPYWGGDIGNTK